MDFAEMTDVENVLNLYKTVIEHVNKSNIKLGWNIDIYPDRYFVETSIKNQKLCVLRENERIIAVAVVNHTVNKEYDDIDWQIKEPKTKISTIHALAVLPECRGGEYSSKLLSEIEQHCISNGDIAIHLDVIDTNIPAYKLYIRNNYKEIDCIKMYYEVVGTREFRMMEKVLDSQFSCYSYNSGNLLCKMSD